jgi:hypothetical protein
MDKITIFIWLVFVHFIVDWVFQTHFQTMNKTKNMKALATHSLIYAFGFAIPFFMFNISFAWLAVLFLSHAIIDQRGLLI